MGFSQSHVARLLGHSDGSQLCRFERGVRLPPLAVAFQLGIVLRVPLEFLFPKVYDELRVRIRNLEEKLRRPAQPTLF